jgi:hypothetical protein
MPDNLVLDRDKSARKRGQLGPYEKTTRTINNHCCLTYFFNLHQNIRNCLYFDWLFTHYVVMSDFYLYVI